MKPFGTLSGFKWGWDAVLAVATLGGLACGGVAWAAHMSYLGGEQVTELKDLSETVRAYAQRSDEEHRKIWGQIDGLRHDVSDLNGRTSRLEGIQR